MAVARYRMICLVLENSRLPTKLHTELPTISVYGCSGQPYLHGKIAMGSLLRCQLSCSLFPYMKGVASLICMAKFLWAAHSAAHWAAHYLYLDAVGCPLSFPLFPYMEVMGSLICMAKFPWAAHGQPTPLPCAAHGQQSGQLPYEKKPMLALCPLPTTFAASRFELPTELPTM